MKIVVFGLTVSSSWGNGHATLWRGLIRSLVRAGHRVTFFERDVPYYRDTRDLTEIPGADLVLYENFEDVQPRARRELREADLGMVTSYCPDGRAAARLVRGETRGVACFYDLDTPVTLARLEAGQVPDYLPLEGLGGFDLVLSYTGGAALTALRERLGAQRVAPLYGHVDPDVHRPTRPDGAFRCDLSYIGTYAADRQPALQALLVEPARRRPEQRFVIAGASYPADFPWGPNIHFVRHLPPPQHPAFFSSSRLTLNVTRADMAAMGWCPSGRLFEAAACACPLISDHWEGLDHFFEPGREILVAHGTEDALVALDLSDAEVGRIAVRARERVLDSHTSAHRAAELVAIADGATRPSFAAAGA